MTRLERLARREWRKSPKCDGLYDDAPAAIWLDRDALRQMIKRVAAECVEIARDRIGTAKYGTRLRGCNGRDALVDAYQEALDLAMYLRQEIWERDHGGER